MIKEKRKNPLLFHPISKSYEILQERILCYYYQYKYASAFAEVSVFLMFLGYPRSAHSMLGALIDAHPETCISHVRTQT